MNNDKMTFVVALQIIYLVAVQTKSYETDRKDSSAFLTAKLSPRRQYEQSRENVETTRESCLDEYRQQQKLPQRRQTLSPGCAQYCEQTTDCQQEIKQSACVNPAYPPWPSRTSKFVGKFERVCYIRVTQVLKHAPAEQLCREHGLELAVIDNMPLLEHLNQTKMFNATCKSQCPETRGYYIGLKRQTDGVRVVPLKWIWSNNVTWTQNETDCGDDYDGSTFANATLHCYLGSDGKKKVTAWNIGEPNNHQPTNYSSGEQCVEIIGRPDRHGSFKEVGRLNDIPCHKATMGAICQMPDLKPVNSTRFESFATLVKFNETEPDEPDLFDNLLNFDGPIAPNLNAMAEMAAALEGLLVLPSFTNKQATNVLNVVDQLVDVTGQIEVEDDSLKKVTNKLLHFLDRFPAKIEINDDESALFKYENMNTSLAAVDFEQWYKEQNGNEWFTIKTNQSDDHPKSIIQLNLRALRAHIKSTDYRIIETIFSNFNLFQQVNNTNQSNETGGQLLGMPVSYQIANWSMIRIDEDLVRIQIQVSEVNQTRNISCVYWSFDVNNGSWIEDDGCRFAGYVDDYAQCYCNHLTHFALLMLPESEQFLEPLSAIEEFILSFVTYIGIGLSIFGLVITLITYLLFRCSQKNQLHYSLFMLSLSILMVNCLYLPFSLTKPDMGGNNYCTLLGFLFHYFAITSFMWMLIMATIQYMYFVRIFNIHISRFVTKTTLLGWIFPLMFPILVLSINANDGYTGKSRCWIRDDVLRYITFLAPISAILLCNLILFLITLKSLCRRNATILTHQTNRSKLQMSAALCCFVSIGCTWVFGILVLIRPTFLHQLIFCISNSLQGFLIFIFHVYLSKPKRDLWQTFFIQRGFHPRPNSSSVGYVGRSSTSDSSGRNISSITRPVKFRFSSTATTNDSTGTMSVIRHSNPDYDGTGLLTKERMQPGRVSNLVLRPQPDFLYDRIQRARMEINNHYA